MLLKPAVAAAIADGTVDRAYRRWAQPRAVVGGTQLTTAGVVQVTSLDEVDPDALTDADALAAGFADLDRLRRSLRPGPEPVFRVGLRWAGPDPRVALRADDVLGADAVAELTRRLDRLDRASSAGAWTGPTLRLIEDHPQRRAPDLAAMVGRETAPFKLDVRKLKALGLTESFPVGYELSPRGIAYLAATRRR